MQITKNFYDLGFGSNTINHEEQPFSTLNSENYSNIGFGSFEYLNFDSNEYVNKKSFNFSSKQIILFKNIVKYEYNEIIEKGRFFIDKNSYKDIKIKNKNIKNPVFICTPAKKSNIIDTTLTVKKINTTTFRVFNAVNKKIDANYIASFLQVKKTKINHDTLLLNKLNKNIKIFIYNN
jgi:hypothetical protein